jgi:lysophospholipase L1-like esterase
VDVPLSKDNLVNFQIRVQANIGAKERQLHSINVREIIFLKPNRKESVMPSMKWLRALAFVATILLPLGVSAEVPWVFTDDTRYMAMGDSLAAGYGAIPATQGYAYLLYKGGVFDKIPNTLLSNVGLIGATSQDVLEKQVPLAIDPFKPDVITLSVGGNDLAGILADPTAAPQILENFGKNLFAIFSQLQNGLPEAKIYINNLYDIPEIPGARAAVQAFNQIVEGVAANPMFNVPVADVFSAFEGRKGLLLIQRNGADPFEVHPSNAGHRAIAKAYKAVIDNN